MDLNLDATMTGNDNETKGPNPPPAIVGNNVFFPPNSLAAPSGYLASGALLPSYNASNNQPQCTMTSTDHQPENGLTFHSTFLKGKPKVLGIVLIVFSVVVIFLGIGSLFTFPTTTAFSGLHFLGPIIYIITGSLTIGAQTRPNFCLMKGSLRMNIVTAVFSFISLTLDFVDLVILILATMLSRNCPDNNNHYFYRECITRSMVGSIIFVLLLLINLLVLCVSISVSVFGCRALAHEPYRHRQVLIVRNDAVVTVPEPIS